MTLPVQTDRPAEFDYSALPGEVATLARDVADRVRSRHQQQIAAIIETGRDLEAVKAKVEHGQFALWLDAEFGWSARTAQRYMQTAILDGKSDTVSYLPPTAVYALTAASTPEPVRNEIMERLEAGEHVDPIEVRDRIKEGKEVERASRISAKLPAKQRRDRRKAAERRQAEEESRRVALRQKQDREREASIEAAAMIERQFGSDLPKFVALLAEANLITFRQLLVGNQE